jgi:hypothetical protein
VSKHKAGDRIRPPFVVAGKVAEARRPGEAVRDTRRSNRDGVFPNSVRAAEKPDGS